MNKGYGHVDTAVPQDHTVECELQIIKYQNTVTQDMVESSTLLVFQDFTPNGYFEFQLVLNLSKTIKLFLLISFIQRCISI